MSQCAPAGHDTRQFGSTLRQRRGGRRAPCAEALPEECEQKLGIGVAADPGLHGRVEVIMETGADPVVEPFDIPVVHIQHVAVRERLGIAGTQILSGCRAARVCDPDRPVHEAAQAFQVGVVPHRAGVGVDCRAPVVAIPAEAETVGVQDRFAHFLRRIGLFQQAVLRAQQEITQRPIRSDVRGEPAHGAYRPVGTALVIADNGSLPSLISARKQQYTVRIGASRTNTARRPLTRDGFAHILGAMIGKMGAGNGI